MIINDRSNYKVDVDFVESTNRTEKEKWLQITVFMLKSETEWTTKIIRLSPETITKLREYLDN